MTDTNDRLDSWKAIADYLNRDVRTLRRWQGQGLPIRRVPGGRGHSVFAFKAEIEEWLRRGGADEHPVAEAPRAPTIPPPPATRRFPRRTFAAAAVFSAIVFGWKTFAPNAAPEQLDVKMSAKGIVATSPTGEEQWRYEFPDSADTVLSTMSTPWFIARGTRPAVFAMTSYQETKAGKAAFGGFLRQFSLDGKLQQSFDMQDRWTFAGAPYPGPWALTDFKVDESFGRRQVAIAAHHYMWRPSVVTILDERFQRQGSFVNSGWIDNVKWLSPDRLAISGFSEALDGGMLAVLDVHDIDGASPEAPGSKFVCDDCRPGRPLNYFVFPRSELNRVTGSRFNRTFIEAVSGLVIARSDEVAQEDNVGGLAAAVYEFTPQMELVRASYGGRYWDKHRALEMEGRLQHSRENCPERDGPPLVKAWTKDQGWQNIRPPR